TGPGAILVPASGASSPERIRSRVDFPLPFSPSRPVGRPAGTTRLTSVRTRRSGKEKEIPSARRWRAGSPVAVAMAEGKGVVGCAGMEQLLDGEGRWTTEADHRRMGAP